MHASATDDRPKPTNVLRILLAEDNQTNAYVAGEFLSDAGHEVSFAADGQKAIDMCAIRKFDLILMDISMPHVDGFQAAKAIRVPGSVNCETQMIALTAHVMEADSSELREAGMSGYLSKPIRRNILLNSVSASCIETCIEVVPRTQELPLDPVMPIIDIQTLRAFADDRAIGRVRKSLSLFVSELQQKRTNLEAIIATRDVAALQMLAHSSLGSGSMVGAARLVSLSRTIEVQCKNGEEVDWLIVETLLLEAMRSTVSAVSEFAKIGAIEALLASEAIAA